MKTYEKTVKKDKQIKNMSKSYTLFCAKLGNLIIQSFAKQMSHPSVKIDMCPDFDNLLILTFGRAVYKFLQTKKAKELWRECSGKKEGE